ncbi:MAG: phage holin family protein [Candidatus Promineifilaceae bacterium]|jgi:uncharacterized membrane protein YvlD (DUF360 family)
MRDLLRVLFRICAVTLIEVIAVLIMHWLVPGIIITGSTSQQILTAVSVAIVLGLLNALIRPLIVLLGLSINLYTVGLFTLIVNSCILLLSAFFLPDFLVDGISSALVGAIVLSIVNTFITGLISIDQDYAYFDGVVSWLSRQNLLPEDQTTSRGLVLLEIDGLSYQRFQQAIDSGLLPTVKSLLNRESHTVTHIECGFPSQSSSCQAGIMYGDNYDIPAFRWYIKEDSKLVVSNSISDSAEINRRFFNGTGLLRGGTSVGNLLSGEAARSLMTISTLLDSSEERPHSGYELSLVFLNPYLLTRAVILTFWDLALEVFQAVRQSIRNVKPRTNRLNRFYPFLRAGLNIFIRDVGTNAVILDVMRGSPAIYMTFMGYDEIAHHAGPDSADALNSLKGFDRSLARIIDVVDRKAPRPYDVFILSDHGQSFGATFRQRSGYTLGEFLDSIVEGESYFAEFSEAEKVRTQITAVLAAMAGLRGHTGEGHTRADVMSRAGKNLGKHVKQPEQTIPTDTSMLVLVGGNLANVYFPQIGGKVTAVELEHLFPGLLENIVAHPDIGLVVTYTESGLPWVIGKSGARNLGDNTITGEADPLLGYGDADLRAAQIKYVAGFPHAGDLIIISSTYAQGQVAAFEELVGSHGGIGGQQTDAFLCHPADMDIPPTFDTTALYPILNERRGSTAAGAQSRPREAVGNPWSWPVLRQGMSNVQGMLGRAARSLRLDRTLFGEVARDPYATGQAVVISILLGLGLFLFPLLSLSWWQQTSPMVISSVIILSVGLSLCLVLATITGRYYHYQNSFTRSFNAITYAGVGGFVAWFAPINFVGPLLLITGTLIVIVACWVAIMEIFDISRWMAMSISLFSFILASLLLVVYDTLFGNGLIAAVLLGN